MNLSGMGMMLKAIGIDPVELEATINGFKTQIDEVATAFQRIEKKLDHALVLMGDSSQPQKEEVIRDGSDGDNNANRRLN